MYILLIKIIMLLVINTKDHNRSTAWVSPCDWFNHHCMSTTLNHIYCAAILKMCMLSKINWLVMNRHNMCAHWHSNCQNFSALASPWSSETRTIFIPPWLISHINLVTSELSIVTISYTNNTQLLTKTQYFTKIKFTKKQ